MARRRGGAPVNRHYLDHASTSPVRPEAVDAMTRWLREPAGDPGRVHAEGLHAREAVEEARAAVAALLGARSREVVFTSGATEAIAAATWGAGEQPPIERQGIGPEGGPAERDQITVAQAASPRARDDSVTGIVSP